MSSILEKITPQNSRYVYEKHNELLAYIGENESEITNRCSLYRQAMQNIVFGELLKPAEIQTNSISQALPIL